MPQHGDLHTLDLADAFLEEGALIDAILTSTPCVGLSARGDRLVQDGQEYNLCFVALDKIKRYTQKKGCLLYTSPSPRDATLSRMPSSA